jgi:hypothetical protein
LPPIPTPPVTTNAPEAVPVLAVLLVTANALVVPELAAPTVIPDTCNVPLDTLKGTPPMSIVLLVTYRVRNLYAGLPRSKLDVALGIKLCVIAPPLNALVTVGPVISNQADVTPSLV